VSLCFLALFFIVFDCIFPALAEVTRLADRGFYGDWWNSTSFADFSSSWNKPVHEFLLRHVHVVSISSLKLSRKYAAMVTFGVSIILHEILITALFGRFRPFLAFFSMFQIPLWPIMRSPFFMNKLTGNAFFWTGLLVGITLVVVLYFSEYCLSSHHKCTLD
jgi:sterol O-acyltransferase